MSPVVSNSDDLGRSVASSLGGGAVYDPKTGQVTGFSTLINGTPYTNVGSAFDATERQITALNSSMPMKYSTTAAPITPSNGATQDATMVGAKAGAAVTLHNVGDGALLDTSTDAVNGHQLKATNDSLAKTNDRLTMTSASLSRTNGDVESANNRLTTTNDSLRMTNDALANLTNNIQNGTVGLVGQMEPTAAVTVAAKTGGKLVSLIGTDGHRALTGISNGTVSRTSSDAMTGQQLYRATDSVATLLGGGSHINPDGSVSQPTYQILGRAYHDVGSALTAGTVNSVQYDSARDGRRLNSITLQGGSPGTVVLHNVAAGVSPSDATNLKQVSDGLTALSSYDRSYTDQKVAAVERRARSAGSAAMAAAGLAFSDEAKGDRSVAIGLGTFRDSISLASGVAYRVNNAVRVKATASYTPETGDVGSSISIGARF